MFSSIFKTEKLLVIKKNCLTKTVISYDLSTFHITQLNDKKLGQFFSIILIIYDCHSTEKLNVKVFNLEYYEPNK